MPFSDWLDGLMEPIELSLTCTAIRQFSRQTKSKHSAQRAIYIIVRPLRTEPPPNEQFGLQRDIPAAHERHNSSSHSASECFELHIWKHTKVHYIQAFINQTAPHNCLPPVCSKSIFFANKLRVDLKRGRGVLALSLWREMLHSSSNSEGSGFVFRKLQKYREMFMFAVSSAKAEACNHMPYTFILFIWSK